MQSWFQIGVVTIASFATFSSVASISLSQSTKKAKALVELKNTTESKLRTELLALLAVSGATNRTQTVDAILQYFQSHHGITNVFHLVDYVPMTETVFARLLNYGTIDGKSAVEIGLPLDEHISVEQLEILRVFRKDNYGRPIVYHSQPNQKSLWSSVIVSAVKKFHAEKGRPPTLTELSGLVPAKYERAFRRNLGFFLVREVRPSSEK